MHNIFAASVTIAHPILKLIAVNLKLNVNKLFTIGFAIKTELAYNTVIYNQGMYQIKIIMHFRS